MFRSKVADVLANVTWYERAKERQEEGSGGGTAWGNLVAVLRPVWPDGGGREAERFRLEP